VIGLIVYIQSLFKQRNNYLFMNQTLSAEATLLSAEHPYISKHVSVFSVILSLLIALLGVAAVVVSVSMDEASDILSMTLLTVGIILILFALYRIFWKSKEVVYVPTGSVVSEGSFYIDSCDLSEMERLVEDKNFNLSGRMTFKQSGNGRLDFMISKDYNFAAVQLFRFVPYTYEPASPVYYYTGDDAVAFARYLGVKNR